MIDHKEAITMMIYEVNVNITNVLLNDYIKWLKPHAQKMLEFDGFESVQYFIQEDKPENEQTQVCIQYQVSSKEHLDNYFKCHVEKMRQDKGIEQFAGHIERTWRVLRFKGKFEACC